MIPAPTRPIASAAYAQPAAICYDGLMIHVANVLILTPDGALILQQRDTKAGISNPGQISAWGGSIESGETPRQAARRELAEELGLQVAEDDLEPWQVYHKNHAVHGEDTEVHLFRLKQRIDPATVTVYEGQGYYLLRPTDQITGVNLTRAAQDFVPAFFAELQP
jgi:8-oxo-dGTP diphosphatase